MWFEGSVSGTRCAGGTFGEGSLLGMVGTYGIRMPKTSPTPRPNLPPPPKKKRDKQYSEVVTSTPSFTIHGASCRDVFQGPGGTTPIDCGHPSLAHHLTH